MDTGELLRLASGTPTVHLETVNGCQIWVKLEYTLPSGSTKDRIAAWILDRAMADGSLRVGGHVVEASSGSTSIAFAMACALIGIDFTALMPAGVSDERVMLIRRYGGKVVLTPPERGLAGAIERAETYADADAAVYFPRQFSNPRNAEAHERTTAAELIGAVDGSIDGFVAGVGTGGTLMGIGRAVRASYHHSYIARVVPDEPQALGCDFEVCAIPGIVEGVASLADKDDVGLAAEIVVPAEEAFAVTRELCRRGFPVGPSSGLNVAGARRMAAELGADTRVATVLPDRVERYFSTELFSDLR